MTEITRKNKALVVYYSFEGNTRYIAEAIAKELGADIQELRPVKDLKSKGFSKYVWGGRQVLMKKKPDLRPLEKAPENYDIIFLGTPVWAYTFSPALRTFFAEHPLKGKKIAFFLCHGGDPKETMAKMEAAVPGNTIIGRLDLKNALEEEPESKRMKVMEWAKMTVEKQ